MTDHITITVPSSDKKALVAGATMLLTLADKLPIVELPDHKTDTEEKGDGANPVAEKVALRVVPDAGEGTTLEEFESESDNALAPDEAIPAVPDADSVSRVNAALEAELAKVPPVPDADAETGDAKSEEIPAVPVADEEPAPDVQLDSTGLPWDSRVHAGTKTFLKSGAWKLKRGVDPDTVTDVEADLRALMATPAAATNLASVPDSDAPDTFPTFLKAVSELIAEGKTDLDKVEAILQDNGARTMAALAARADLIPQVWAAVIADE